MQAVASTWFGNYEVLERLQVGGMATLYLARRHGAAGFSRPVALKLIHPRLTARPEYVEMFVDEARICAQISHPNVVHVEDFGAVDGVHYLAMEYLDGCSVGELLHLLWSDHRMLDPELVARIVMQVASGLHAAHETRGPDGEPLDIIHRDISPSNILLSLAGNAKLIDFGLARARNRRFETQGDGVKGKYDYMAPEQARRGPVDRRCDIFALGVVFWELLVGWPLFPDSTIAGLSKRLDRTDVLAPSVANPWISAVFDTIVLDMLWHHPAERLQTAAEVQRRIAAAAPDAANRDGADLGALVREVCERRRAQRGRGGKEGSSSHVRFPPAARSKRSSSRSDLVEVGPAAAPGERGPAAGQAAPTRRRMRHRALVIAAGLSVLGVAAGMLIERRDERPGTSAPATPAHRSEIELVEVSRPADPPTGTTLPPSPAVPLPMTASGSASGALPPPRRSPEDIVASPPPAPSIPGRAAAHAPAIRAAPPVLSPARAAHPPSGP